MLRTQTSVSFVGRIKLLQQLRAHAGLEAKITVAEIFTEGREEDVRLDCRVGRGLGHEIESQQMEQLRPQDLRYCGVKG